jgi:hypothetical protein
LVHIKNREIGFLFHVKESELMKNGVFITAGSVPKAFPTPGNKKPHPSERTGL